MEQQELRLSSFARDGYCISDTTQAGSTCDKKMVATLKDQSLPFACLLPVLYIDSPIAQATVHAIF